MIFWLLESTDAVIFESLIFKGETPPKKSSFVGLEELPIFKIIAVV